MPAGKFIPYHQFDLSGLPGALKNALDTAAAECKRLGHTCLGLPHLLLGMLRNCPNLLTDKVPADRREQVELGLKQRLETSAAEFNPDVMHVSLPESLAAVINQVFSRTGGQAPATGFLQVIEAQEPGQIERWLGSPAAAGQTGTERAAPAAAGPPAGPVGEPPRPPVAAQGSPTTPAPPPPPPSGKEAQPSPPTPPTPSPSPPAPGTEPIRPPFTNPWDTSTLADAPADLPGRDWEVQTLAIELSRQRPGGVIVVGPPKCGKTALVRGFARLTLAGTWKALEGSRFYALDIPSLIAGVPSGRVSHADFVDSLTKIADLPKSVLVVDPAHVFFGLGGPPGFHDLWSAFRAFLLRGSLRVLFVTVPRFLDTVIENDLIFGQLPRVSLGFLEEAALARTIDAGRQNLEKAYGKVIPAERGAQALELHGDRGRKQVYPGIALKTLETACLLADLDRRSEVTQEDLLSSFQREKREQVTTQQERLGHLEEELARWVKGQPEAIKAVAPRIRMTRLQLDRNPNRPDGVFLFLGPSGVGKTELAKAITWSLYGDLTRLIRLDMSEYMEHHEYSKLIGAPPGYIGHGEEGHLTGPVARLGHGVVLLDEMEKAHPAILKMFLQVFDEGFLTDGRGNRVDFSRCVVVMTSNLGRELYAEGKAAMGFLKPREKEMEKTPESEAVLDYLLKILPSEFVNRIDQVVPFRPLSREHLADIARKMLDEEAARWLKRGTTLTFGDGIIPLLIDAGYDPRFGARHLTRNFERSITQVLSEAACQPDWGKFRLLELTVEAGSIKLSRK